jgi:hypothetical protein
MIMPFLFSKQHAVALVDACVAEPGSSAACLRDTRKAATDVAAQLLQLM